ncbi:hypothetical protein Patl1_27168 [Pistacia atlantica]|uniref:Uncharacterized protein n=1 Tax=Pistacia atlantica TaxID=434234 RepID=A0ACC1B3T2_9ROSI|nr:hypothetical protein Patl1_27168 [Pistacia atlantica]
MSTLPNKSLDFFIFDSHKKKVLNWKIRFNIIEGNCSRTYLFTQILKIKSNSQRLESCQHFIR